MKYTSSKGVSGRKRQGICFWSCPTESGLFAVWALESLQEIDYGHIFLTSLVYNFIQFLRLHLDGMSFKDALESSSAYLLWKSPPACVFEVAGVLDRVFGYNGYERLDKMNSLCEGRMVGLEGAMG